jgi:D-arginine dehydrogenase
VAGAADILIIGGGIAGLSLAAALAREARVTVLEAEPHIGFHSSGRSATMVHYALGDRLVRELTLASRPFFDDPPDGFSDAPLGKRMPVLVFARDEEAAALDALGAELAMFAPMERLDAAAVAQLCPLLRPEERHGIADHDGLRLDPHALLQGNLRVLRHAGGAIVTGARIAAIVRQGGTWQVRSEGGERWVAPILINAAGAWADQIAQLAGVAPLGLVPKRRTIITFDAPPTIDVDRLPFAKTVGNGLYFAPESGRLFASPMDEGESDPCDAQPDEYDLAVAAERVEERTIVSVARIHSRWAGLRTFTPDAHPALGFAADAQGFFWLAGQGGYGLQTSPALAAAAASVISGKAWPLTGVAADALSPGRFAGQTA